MLKVSSCWRSRPVRAMGLAFGLCLGAALPASAATIGYSLDVNVASLNILRFTLENTSADQQITGLEITVGDTAYLIDDSFLFLSGTSDPGGDLTVSVNAPNPNVQADLVDADLLSFSFTGFDPGDRFAFDMDLDLDGTNSVVTQTVLYNNGAAPNSQVTVDFTSGQLSMAMPDDPALSGSVFNLSQSGTPILAVAEPASLGLFALALVGLSALRRARA